MVMTQSPTHTSETRLIPQSCPLTVVPAEHFNFTRNTLLWTNGAICLRHPMHAIVYGTHLPHLTVWANILEASPLHLDIAPDDKLSACTFNLLSVNQRSKTIMHPFQSMLLL